MVPVPLLWSQEQRRAKHCGRSSWMPCIYWRSRRTRLLPASPPAGTSRPRASSSAQPAASWTASSLWTAQDLWVHEDEAITLHCDVPFAVPPELQVTWMFAKDIRTQDLALFEELHWMDPTTVILQTPRKE
ncbi:uncharacterized protein LOC128083394 isoform X4 [Tympanuchus pallidicinctus]|uniref:uncharacterized protein LOC128083394 isoform X4 n=1 Tax=Tympanuchus pallidicinctus TaxID=109042 RepID=UPI0022874116|nr:uncharacterized protein LOC128083394 isoform X4 [Tympanuchus pallidicinctus]